jgi:hypothetical protein
MKIKSVIKKNKRKLTWGSNDAYLCVVWARTFSSYPCPHVPAVRSFPPLFDPPIAPASCHPHLVHAVPVIGPVSRPRVSPSISTPHPPREQLLAAVVVGAGSWWCPGGRALPCCPRAGVVPAVGVVPVVPGVVPVIPVVPGVPMVAVVVIFFGCWFPSQRLWVRQ